MWCGGSDRSSRILALRRAPRKSTCPQPGWLLGLCQWALGAGDPLDVDVYEFVSRLEELGGLAISVGGWMWCGGHGRSSRTLALMRAPRMPRAIGDLQHGWRLEVCQWARGAGDPLGVDPYEFVARLLTLCLTRIPQQSFDYCLSMSVWMRWLLEMLVWLVLAARLG